MSASRTNLPESGRIRRILVIRWSALGDVAIASAACEDLARAFPRAELHLNTMPPWDTLFEHDPRFAKVISIPMREPGHRLSGIRRWLSEVRAGRYDLVVDLQSNDRSRLLLTALWLSGTRIPHRIGLRPGWPYTIAPRPPLPLHAADRQRLALAAAGIDSFAAAPVFAIGEDRPRAMQALLAGHGLAPGRFALFLPGSQAAGWLKRWGERRFAALARAVVAAGLVERVALAGAGDDADTCAEIARQAGPVVANLCGRTRVLDLVPLAGAARFVVSNDTGPAHVASAASRPMVVLCGPTDPRRVKPMGASVTTLQAPLHCASCYRKTCTHHSCMMLISPESVLERLHEITADRSGALD